MKENWIIYTYLENMYRKLDYLYKSLIVSDNPTRERGEGVLGYWKFAGRLLSDAGKVLRNS